MKSFKDIVKEVSDKFLQEAKKSPQLIADMAKMEYYMAESYSGRLFVELLQNADDAKSTRIISYYNHGNLYFANNGKPFDENDLSAISRSGASGKKRGKTIGYRGIGFKSASSISNEIIIYSSNTYFTFSKEKCAKLLKMPVDEVPTIRIPLMLEDVEKEVKEDIELLKENGYSTVFVFMDADISQYLDELKDVDEGYFIFLNNVYECVFDINDFSDKYQINRFTDSGNEHVEISSEKCHTEWMTVKNKNTAVSFLIEDGKIVPCEDSKAVYHCYLPTLEKSIIACKINADFSTDPSRKHITMDDKTKDSLQQVASIFASTLEMAFDEADTGKYKNILSMYLKKSTVSKMNFYLDEIVEDKIKDKKWVKLESGEKVSPCDYKVFPSTFDIEKPELVRTVPGEIAADSAPKMVYDNIDDVDLFMSQYSNQVIGMDTISRDLSDASYVKNLDSETHTQLLTNAIREAKVEKILNGKSEANLNEYVVKTKGKKFKKIKDVVQKKEKLDEATKKELDERLAGSEVKWLQEQVGSEDLIKECPASDDVFAATHKRIDSEKSKSDTLTVHIAKWRDAENKCVAIEESFGNEAEDVSLKNYGYDVESVTPDGKKRYIEVKSVKKDFSFSLTNNEYTAAHQYGEEYYVCLLLEDENNLEVRYIQNPLQNAKFEKRIKQWEWLCLECDTTAMTFDLED